MSLAGIVPCFRLVHTRGAEPQLRRDRCRPRRCLNAAGGEHALLGVPTALAPPAAAVLATLFEMRNSRPMQRKVKRRKTRLQLRSKSDFQVKSETQLLVVAERYTSFYWWQHMVDFPGSQILDRIKLHVSFNTILAGVVWLLERETNAVHALPVMPLTLCSAALGLLLVFRTTAAYERWHLGQRSVYELRHHLQMILRVARLWIPEANFVRLQEQVRRLPRAVAVRLTAQAGAGFLYGVSPREVMQELSEDLTEHFSDPAITWGALGASDRIQGHIDAALLLVTQMERLAMEAVPRAYSRHTGRFLTIWMWTLPWVLLDCGDAMPLAVAVISWALLGIEEIGHCLEDPFNSPIQPVEIQAILEAGGGQDSLAPSTATPYWERDAGDGFGVSRGTDVHSSGSSSSSDCDTQNRSYPYGDAGL